MGNNVPKITPVFRSDFWVTLLGGGALGATDLDEVLALAPRLVAADGGAGTALENGLVPEAVYGDLDSLHETARARIPADRIHRLPEQDSTDFDKALRHIHAPLILAAGFTGDRVDHELAVYHGLVARADQRCIVVGPRDVVFHAPPALRLPLPNDTRLSLFPFAQVTGRSAGLVWPIDRLVFDPARRIGTSNRTGAGQVDLSFEGPGMLVIAPRAHLAAVAKAVAAASVWSRAGGTSSV